MNLFDVVGPVMVGPSSSHTAGAVRIGYVSRKLLGENVKNAKIQLCGSFLATGVGHGTSKALVAGLLGFLPDDERIPHSIELAEENGVSVSFGEAALKDAHPNSVKLILDGVNGAHMEIVGESVGGGRINIASINGLRANFSGAYPTLIVYNRDEPGVVAQVTSLLALWHVNLVTMQLHRANRGGSAVMIIECDQEPPADIGTWLEKQDGIEKVICFRLESHV